MRRVSGRDVPAICRDDRGHQSQCEVGNQSSVVCSRNSLCVGSERVCGDRFQQRGCASQKGFDPKWVSIRIEGSPCDRREGNDMLVSDRQDPVRADKDRRRLVVVLLSECTGGSRRE